MMKLHLKPICNVKRWDGSFKMNIELEKETKCRDQTVKFDI